MAWAKRSGSAAIYRTTTHKQARTKALAAYQPGDPCALCHHPMWPDTDGSTAHLHLDHDPLDTTRYRGLTHGSTPCQDCGQRCNVADGARRGRARKDRPTRWTL
jgi:hypothetical protein